MKLHIDTWYDLACDCCARSWSTDFENGMSPSKEKLSKSAYRKGWKCRKGKNLCPDCSTKPDHIISGENQELI